jgi:basic membrane protein A
MKVAAILVGYTDDGGFIESGYRGLINARDRLGVQLETRIASGIEVDDLLREIRAAAQGACDLIVVHGGKSDLAVEQAAQEFPHIHFLSTHGTRAGRNFSAHGVKQYESAFLAGAAAALLTRSGVAGHLSGIRIAPGLRGRAAYAAGLRHTNPAVRLVTCFCGTQDDVEIAHQAARLEIEAGIDVLFTMLNYSRSGAIEACREAGVKQIGNVRDWHVEFPDVFVGSAIADTGELIFRWLAQRLHDNTASGTVMQVGIEEPAVVRMELAAGVPTQVDAYIRDLAGQVLSGEVTIPERYDGPEMDFQVSR